MFAVPPDLRLQDLGRAVLVCGLAFAGAVSAAQTGVAHDAADRVAADTNAGLVAQAIAYEHGEGVTKDPLRAAALYCEAARDGDPEAQYSLGWMYANGRGVARDDVMAAALFTLAAAAGHAHAQRAVGFVGADGGTLPECMRPPAAPDVPVSAEFDIVVEDPTRSRTCRAGNRRSPMLS